MSAPAFGFLEAMQAFKWTWILLTVAVYAGSLRLMHASPRLLWLNPLVLSIIVMVLILLAADVPYATYFKGAQWIHELLAPATVALAIPLARQLRRMRDVSRVALAAGVGGAASIVTVWLLAKGLGASSDTLVPLTVKSITMPIALAITEGAGAAVSLAAVFVMLTGLLGSVMASPALSVLRLNQAKYVGFALGVCAHGIGVARAFQIDEEAGSWAVLGMGMAGILAALALPLALRFAAG
jgi:putative effector of murein hydrolase